MSEDHKQSDEKKKFDTDDKKVFKIQTDNHEQGTRWGWFGYTPDCLQRFNTGFCWGLTITFASFASNCVFGGLGKFIYGQYTHAHTYIYKCSCICVC